MKMRFLIDAPGHFDHGKEVVFDTTNEHTPRMNHREAFQLADGTMAHVVFDGAVGSPSLRTWCAR